MICRFCGSSSLLNFINLGFAPPSNAYLNFNQLSEPEKYFPLRVVVCENCWLAQTEDFIENGNIFNENYAYFSSTSKSWLKHAKDYSEKIIKDLSLDEKSFVVEIASNDGYLLKNFVERKIPCLGVEPSIGTASVAEKIGVRVFREFFNSVSAEKILNLFPKADLIIGNNVYAHVPDVVDFTKALKNILSNKGVITLEFPHLLSLIKNNQFDTIYHEHFSYFTLKNVINIFTYCGLRVFDVEEISTHGGSLRIFGCHDESSTKNENNVKEILEKEELFNLNNPRGYQNFQTVIETIKNDFVKFMISIKENNKSIIGYGAAAKGNTLLNFAGIRKDLLPAIADASTYKQGLYMPGSHIPIIAPNNLSDSNYDYVVIFPWNIRDEIIQTYNHLRQRGTKFVTVIPNLQIL